MFRVRSLRSSVSPCIPDLPLTRWEGLVVIAVLAVMLILVRDGHPLLESASITLLAGASAAELVHRIVIARPGRGCALGGVGD